MDSQLAPGRLVDGALDLLKRHPLPILGPLVLLGLVGAALAPAPRDVRSASHALASFLAFLAIFMGGALAWMLSVRAALDAASTSREPDLGSAWRGAASQYWGALGTLALYGLAIAAGLVLLVAPAVFLLVAWFPFLPVVLAEGRRGPDALRRAWALTEGHRWNVFVTFLIAIVGYVLAGVLAAMPVLGELLSAVAVALVNGFVACLVALFYSRRTENRPMPSSSPSAIAGP